MSEVSFEEIYIQPDELPHPLETYWELQGATIQQILQHERYQAAHFVQFTQVSFTPDAYQFPPNARSIILKYCNVPGPFPFSNQERFLSIEGMNLGFSLVLPPMLTSLHLDACDLIQVPVLPNTLTQLQMNLLAIQGELFTHLPNPLPPLLNVLSATTNGLLEVPPLPPQLISLNVSENQLTQLPALPDGLSTLAAHTNNLTELPVLPAGLTELDVHQNQLRELPLPLPPNLKLYAYNLEGNPWNIPFARWVVRIPQIEEELGYGPAVQQQVQQEIRQELATQIQAANARQRGRNVIGARQILSKAGLPSSGVLNTITSFLSGKTGSSKQQTLKVREEASRSSGAPGAQGGGRKRKTMRKRKNLKRKH